MFLLSIWNRGVVSEVVDFVKILNRINWDDRKQSFTNRKLECTIDLTSKRQTQGYLTQVENVVLKCLQRVTSAEGQGFLYDSESTSLRQGSPPWKQNYLCSADKIRHLIFGQTSCSSHLPFGFLQSYSLLSIKVLKNAILFIPKIMLINFVHITFTPIQSNS